MAQAKAELCPFNAITWKSICSVVTEDINVSPDPSPTTSLDQLNLYCESYQDHCPEIFLFFSICHPSLSFAPYTSIPKVLRTSNRKPQCTSKPPSSHSSPPPHWQQHIHTPAPITTHPFSPAKQKQKPTTTTMTSPFPPAKPKP